MSLPQLSSQDFDRQLAVSPRLVVKFTAAWCAPCKAFSPTVEAAAQAHPGIDFVEVDLEREPGLAQRWNVRNLPTTLGFRDGQVVFQVAGAMGLTAFEKHLSQLER